MLYSSAHKTADRLESLLSSSALTSSKVDVRQLPAAGNTLKGAQVQGAIHIQASRLQPAGCTEGRRATPKHAADAARTPARVTPERGFDVV